MSCLVLMASWFSINILWMRPLFCFDTQKKFMKRMHVCNLEIQIEETSLRKARKFTKENVKKYQNIKISTNNSNLQNWTWTCIVTYWFEKVMGALNFFLYFHFEIPCRSRFKFPIGNLPKYWSEIFFLIENPNF